MVESECFTVGFKGNMLVSYAIINLSTKKVNSLYSFSR